MNIIIDDKTAGILLKYCSKCPEYYNKVSNMIYKKFDIHSAELSLLITYIAKEIENEQKED